MSQSYSNAHFLYFLPDLTEVADFTQLLQDTTAKSGQTITLECRVSNPKAEVKWYKNGYQMFTYDRIKVTSEGQRRAITIKRVEARDYGLYTCECGTARTSAELRVLGKYYLKTIVQKMGEMVQYLKYVRQQTSVDKNVSMKGELAGTPLCSDTFIIPLSSTLKT